MEDESEVRNVPRLMIHSRTQTSFNTPIIPNGLQYKRIMEVFLKKIFVIVLLTKNRRTSDSCIAAKLFNLIFMKLNRLLYNRLKTSFLFGCSVFFIFLFLANHYSPAISHETMSLHKQSGYTMVVPSHTIRGNTSLSLLEYYTKSSCNSLQEIVIIWIDDNEIPSYVIEGVRNATHPRARIVKASRKSLNERFRPDLVNTQFMLSMVFSHD
jgi:hypothetical protein